MSNYKLTVQAREAVGGNRVNKLRTQQIIPAVVYHRGEETENVQVDEKAFNKVYAKAGTSTLVDLDLEGQTLTVLIKEVQAHPLKGTPLHVDFQEVNMNEEVRVVVPVVLRGRDDIRVQPSVLLQFLDEIEVTCLPADIPQTAEVEVSEMQIGDTKTVADLDIAANDKLHLEFEPEEPVCALNMPEEGELPEEAGELSAADVPEVGKEESKEEEA